MPEFIFLGNSLFKGFVLPFTSQIDTLIFSMYDYENTTNPVILVPHFLLYWLFVFYFFYIFFSYYSSSVKEESIIDHDFLIANVTVEAEEEIGSIDDILIGSSLLVFIFF